MTISARAVATTRATFAPRLVAVALFALVAAPAVSARTLTVGADSACTHHSLAAAIAEANRATRTVDVRVARNAVHVLPAAPVLGERVRVVGGYSNCSDDSALGVTAVRVASSSDADTLMASQQVRRIEATAADVPNAALADVASPAN